jgi:hypothetical protein
MECQAFQKDHRQAMEGEGNIIKDSESQKEKRENLVLEKHLSMI